VLEGSQPLTAVWVNKVPCVSQSNVATSLIGVWHLFHSRFSVPPCIFVLHLAGHVAGIFEFDAEPNGNGWHEGSMGRSGRDIMRRDHRIVHSEAGRHLLIGRGLGAAENFGLLPRNYMPWGILILFLLLSVQIPLWALTLFRWGKFLMGEFQPLHQAKPTVFGWRWWTSVGSSVHGIAGLNVDAYLIHVLSYTSSRRGQASRISLLKQHLKLHCFKL